MRTLEEIKKAGERTDHNLCDYCTKEQPVCTSKEDVVLGDGKGDDNVIQCRKYEDAVEEAIKHSRRGV